MILKEEKDYSPYWVPRKNEICISIDKNKVKYGNGIDSWGELQYTNKAPKGAVPIPTLILQGVLK